MVSKVSSLAKKSPPKLQEIHDKIQDLKSNLETLGRDDTLFHNSILDSLKQGCNGNVNEIKK